MSYVILLLTRWFCPRVLAYNLLSIVQIPFLYCFFSYGKKTKDPSAKQTGHSPSGLLFLFSFFLFFFGPSAFSTTFYPTPLCFLPAKQTPSLSAKQAGKKQSSEKKNADVVSGWGKAPPWPLQKKVDEKQKKQREKRALNRIF